MDRRGVYRQSLPYRCFIYNLIPFTYKMGEILKVFKNKKNNQLFVPIPRKKFDLKDKDPISIEIDKIKLRFEIVKKKRSL